MAIEKCVACDGLGFHRETGIACQLCEMVGWVDCGEHVEKKIPPDAASDWPEEPTQEMPAYRGRPGQEAA